MRFTGYIPLYLLLLALISIDAQAQKPKAAPAKTASSATANVKKITSVEGITEYSLPNGLRVLLFPDPSKPKITVNITYLVGSRMEGYGETGMAHLLEHMLFKGSTKHPKIPDELTAHGSSPNGTTYYDRTNYYETFNESDENLNWALSLEADRMVNSFVAEKDLKSEYSVVRNEFESGENNPSGILQERVLSTMYLWHNYGKSTIGSKEDIEKVPIKNLQAFYKKYYQPDNAVLLVAGKIDEQKTLALIVKYFGSIPRPSRVLEPTYTVEPVQDGERHVTLNRVGDVQTVACGYHIVAGPDNDYAAFDILNDVLTNQPNGRLYKSMVKTELASDLYADDPALKDPTYFYITANVLKEKSLDKAKDAMFKTIDELASKPITDEEVEKAKNKILKGFEQVYRNTQYIGLTLSEFIAQGDWRLAFIYRDNLKKVTAADVNRIVKAYIINSNRTVGLFIPTTDPVRAPLPAQPDVAAITKDYKGQEALAQAEAFDPSPANIDKRTARGTIQGGAKFALLTKTTRGNTVEGRITLRIGDEKSLENKSKIASLTASMLKKGTKTHTLAQINETLDKLSSSVFIYGYGQSVSIVIKSTKANLSQALDLVREMLREPSFPEEEFKTLKNETLSELEQNRSEPQSIAFQEFDRICNPKPKGHINYTMTTDEEVEAIKNVTLRDVKSFYSDFYGSSSATTAFVGDFDATAVNLQLDKMLGNWNAPKPYIRIPDTYNDVAAANKEIKTPDKKNAMMVCGMSLKMRDDHPDAVALKLGNFIFGGGFLNSRLATRIRQKEGISYGVGSYVQVSAQDESGTFGSYAIYNPDNKAKLEAAWNEELSKMLKEGFTEDELKQAKSGYIQYRESGRAEDGQLAGTLNSYLYLGRMMSWEQDIDNKLQKLTAAQVNTVMKKYLFANKIIFVKAGDFK
jgi:zinc protease